MIRPIALFAVLLAVAAAPVAAQNKPAAPAAVKVVPARDLLIRRTGPGFSWRWRAAPELALAPALLTMLRADGTKAALRARRNADADAAAAAAAKLPFRGHEHIQDWSLAADTGRLLALSGRLYAYTGGAHGNTTYEVRLWDKQSRRALQLSDLFSDWPRAQALLQPAFCTALAEERRRRFPDQPAGTCPDFSTLPMQPFGDLSPAARQLRVLVAPYVAGAYSEGSYLITLTWPDGIGALTHQRYRADLGLE